MLMPSNGLLTSYLESFMSQTERPIYAQSHQVNAVLVVLRPLLDETSVLSKSMAAVNLIHMLILLLQELIVLSFSILGKNVMYLHIKMTMNQ